MDDITLNQISASHTYRKTDNRRDKNYSCTVEYQITIFGEDIKSLPLGELLRGFRNMFPEAKGFTHGGHTEGGGIRIRAHQNFPSLKPSKILSEERAMEETAGLLDALTNKDYYQVFIDQTNKKREKIAESYEPLFKEIRKHLKRIGEIRTQNITSMKVLLDYNPGSLGTSLSWDVDALYMNDYALMEWNKVLHDLTQALSRAEDPLESLEDEVTIRIESLCSENRHNSTSIMSNAFNYLQGQVERSILKALRWMLSNLKRDNR